MSIRPPRRRVRDYILPFCIIMALGVLVAVSIRLGAQVLTDGEAPAIGATTNNVVQITELSGEVEAWLPAAEAWKILEGTGVTLAAGERLRTAADGTVELVFDDGTQVLVAPASEIELSELSRSFRGTSMRVALSRGAVWVTSAGQGVDFAMQSRLLTVSDADGSYLLESDVAGEDVRVSAVRGGLLATVLDPQDARSPELEAYEVMDGQTLAITERRVNLLRIGGDIDLVRDTPDDIATRAIYVAGLAGLPAPVVAMVDDGIAAPDVADRTDLPTDVPIDDGTVATAPVADTTPVASLAAPTVSQPRAGSTLVAEPVEVRGTVPAGTTAVEVTANGGAPYQLAGFSAGDTSFLYRARESFGNLRVGQNEYAVVAIADGVRSPVATVRVVYQPVVDSSENTVDDSTTEPADEPATVDAPAEDTGGAGVPAVGAETMRAPTVSEPVDGATYIDAPVAFRGTVPAGTAYIEVNGYRLGQGFSGGTEWFYNAAPEYENLAVGENEYEIEAFADDGRSSSVTIKIIFTPEN